MFDYFTVILHFAVLPLVVLAVIVAVPFFLAVTTPLLLTVATLFLLLVNVTLSVELPGVIVAFNFNVLPFLSVAEVFHLSTCKKYSNSTIAQGQEPLLLGIISPSCLLPSYQLQPTCTIKTSSTSVF